MHNRSIRKTRFELPCNKLLRDMLGKYGAINGFIEMSCQHMNESVKDLDETELRAYLREESAKYGIQLYDLPANLYPLCITQSLMVLPWATLDSFYRHFAREVRMLVSVDFEIKKKDNETKLAAALKALKTVGCKPQIEQFKLGVYAYYNEIRTNFVHNLHDDKALKDEMRLYKGIDQAAINAFFPTIKAPSEPDKLTYADFVLFTATIVNIADLLTISIEEKIDWDLYFSNQFKNLNLKRELHNKKDNKWKDVRVDFPKVDGHQGESKYRYIEKCVRMIYGITPPRAALEKKFALSNNG